MSSAPALLAAGGAISAVVVLLVTAWRCLVIQPLKLHGTRLMLIEPFLWSGSSRLHLRWHVVYESHAFEYDQKRFLELVWELDRWEPGTVFGLACCLEKCSMPRHEIPAREIPEFRERVFASAKRFLKFRPDEPDAWAPDYRTVER